MGLIVATGFNVDSIQIAEKLSQDEDARRFFVEASDKVIKDGKTDSLLRADAIQIQRQALDSMFTQSFQIQNVLALDRCKDASTPENACEKCTFFKEYFYSNGLNFLGCFITAIAISLGSPFWFDLLNKFMQLRGSVAGGAARGKKKLISITENGEPIKG